MSVPAGWMYVWRPSILNWARKLPLAWIQEGTSTIQCLCPSCDYAQGYNEAFHAVGYKERIATCKSCGTTFVALVTNAKD